MAGGKRVKIAKATADFSQENYPIAAAVDADGKTGWAIYPRTNQNHFAVFSFEAPLKIADGKLEVKLAFDSGFDQHQIGHLKISATDSNAPHEEGVSPSVVATLKTPEAERTAKQKAELLAFFRANYGGDVLGADRALAKAEADKNVFEQTIPTAMVMEELPKPREAHVLLRGQYDHPGEVVMAGVPAALNPMPAGAPMNRLGLAQWIVAKDNPLTARVQVNRFWEKFFGTGIVKTSENFGSQAEWPSHPELLDWLATEFVRLGWDQKAIQKEIVMSATYRQSSRITPQLLERDPENRLLARGPRFRVQAEIVRDQALEIAGLLVNQIGGPSVRPYQPPGIWDELSVYGNLHNYNSDTGGNEYRRSLYTIWKRTTPPPEMTIFDMPGRETCVVKRSRTNTPLQALALMNDETFVESSRRLAEQMIQKGGATPAERIDYAMKTTIARPATAEERRVLVAGFESRLARFKQDADGAKKLIAIGDSKADPKLDPAELAAYTTTASVIFNLDEAVTKE
jgi:hypothetical protein